MKEITIYGKGGTGKSTTTSNLSAALTARDLRVMQIGCNPKADSTENLMVGEKIPTALDQIYQKEKAVSLEDIAFRGYGSIVCMESGGPTLGIGCVRGDIIIAFGKLKGLEAYEALQPGVVFYDVLGDVVCGGSVMPVRGGYTGHVMIITSGEMTALFMADNIAHTIRDFGKRGYTKSAGFIQNSRSMEEEDERMYLAVEENGTGILHIVSRDRSVWLTENQGITMVEAYPDSPMAACYQTLADKVLEITGT